ncbi:hypothetical protein [Sporocytophaga myxococcoides]|nr:hypothetical protein [Sporocytophaga myxococcoides]
MSPVSAWVAVGKDDAYDVLDGLTTLVSVGVPSKVIFEKSQS